MTSNKKYSLTSLSYVKTVFINSFCFCFKRFSKKHRELNQIIEEQQAALAHETEISKVVTSLRMLDSLINDLDVLTEAQKRHLNKARIKTLRVDK